MLVNFICFYENKNGHMFYQTFSLLNEKKEKLLFKISKISEVNGSEDIKLF